MDYMLKTCGLSKKFGKTKALDNLSMQVPKGSIYGFIGRNGAGKTTLIRVICGLQEPTDGTYYIDGINNTEKDISAIYGNVGAVVESPAIYLDMSAEDNLKQQCLILGIRSYDAVPELLDLVGLGDTGKKHARHFSLGMKQRLGIAVALVGNPDFLVLDEPVNGLDPQGIIDIRELILRLNRERHITVLISSHILDELARLATHYGFIDKGRIVREINAEELKAQLQKCIRVEVSDLSAIKRILDAWKLDYEIVSGNTVNVFGEIGLPQLIRELAEENCELLSIQEQDESLEDYFIKLIGGEDNA